MCRLMKKYGPFVMNLGRKTSGHFKQVNLMGKLNRALDTNYTLNESEAKKILMTPKRFIKESSTFNDIKLPREERLKYASGILRIRNK